MTLPNERGSVFARMLTSAPLTLPCLVEEGEGVTTLSSVHASRASEQFLMIWHFNVRLGAQSGKSQCGLTKEETTQALEHLQSLNESGSSSLTVSYERRAFSLQMLVEHVLILKHPVVVHRSIRQAFRSMTLQWLSHQGCIVHDRCFISVRCKVQSRPESGPNLK